MHSTPFRVGLIGGGGIARAAHVPAWLSLPGVEIVGVADPQETAARQTAEAAGGARVFTDPAELLGLGLHAVDICTPNRTHAPLALAALAAGCHVLCEKPLATTTAEVRAMGSAADAAGKVLCTVQNHRYRAETRALRDWAKAGHLGEVYHARVRAMRRAWLPPRAGFIDASLSGGGPCMDIGVHALDAALWVMGFPRATRVSGVSKVNFAHGHKIPGRWGEWDRSAFSVEDFAAGFVHLENGGTLTLETSWMGHQRVDEDFSFELFGTEAGVNWPSGEFATVQGGAFVEGRVAGVQAVAKPHHAQIAAFHEACLAGGPSPVPWVESLEVITILEAIYASQRAGREVELSSTAAAAMPPAA
jgi:predicted dehydrogenase